MEKSTIQYFDFVSEYRDGIDAVWDIFFIEGEMFAQRRYDAYGELGYPRYPIRQVIRKGFIGYDAK